MWFSEEFYFIFVTRTFVSKPKASLELQESLKDEDLVSESLFFVFASKKHERDSIQQYFNRLYNGIEKQTKRKIDNFLYNGF